MDVGRVRRETPPRSPLLGRLYEQGRDHVVVLFNSMASWLCQMAAVQYAAMSDTVGSVGIIEGCLV